MSLVADKVSYSVDGRALLESASLRLEPGRVHAVLGPNGAGKSTLLKLLSGDLDPASGSVELNGRPLPEWSPLALARQRAVLPQAHALAFGFTAAQVVALGRLPCPRLPAAEETARIRDALGQAGVTELESRRYTTLSGGERARVQLARVIAQVNDPLEGKLKGLARFLLLDEPTAHLDLAHQHDCMRSARRLAARGLGVLVIVHDPNLALRYADAVTLLNHGKVVAHGRPEEALTEGALEDVYHVPVRVLRAAGREYPVAVVGEALRPQARAP